MIPCDHLHDITFITATMFLMGQYRIESNVLTDGDEVHDMIIR